MELTNATWRKSTRSSGNSGNCVEVADNLPGIIGIRDSKDPNGPALTLPPVGWTAFVAGIRRGRFDR